MGFLADPKYLKYKGFELADTAEPYFELWYMPFSADAKKPCRNVDRTSQWSIIFHGNGFL